MAKRVWLILLFSIVAWAERCDPPAQITAFLNALPDDNTERRKLIGESLKSSPGDFWLNMSFLDGSVYQRSAVREKYRLKFQENRTLENQYLYGRSLVGFDTIQALRLYS